MDFTIGQRILYNDERCTVRFVGHISEWGEEIEALGIEFDIDVHQGKNSGLGYFPTYRNLRQGLFCKINEKLKKKVKLGVEFEKALYYQYSNIKVNENGEQVTLNDVEPVIEFNSKIVEKYGFDDLCKHNANFKNLSMLSLESMKISTFGSTYHTPLSLPKLVNLDLSRNLFISFNSLMEFLFEICPNLENLDLTSNNFNQSSSTLSNKFSFQSLKVLNLTSCCITKDILFSILSPDSCLNNLEDLNLTNNFISDEWFDHLNEVFPNRAGKFERNNHLRSLNLSNNCLIGFPWIIFKMLPNIENLDISVNRISIIPKNILINNYMKESQFIVDLDLKDINKEIFGNLKSLNLNYNDMQMLDLDIVNYKFPGLFDLQINYNLKMIKQIIDQCTNQDDPDDINQRIMKIKNMIKYDTKIYSNNYAEILHVSDNTGVTMNTDIYEIDNIINYELFVNTIYRFNEDLQKLNNSLITNDRKNSELYFISKFQSLPNLRFSKYNIKRFDQICFEYNCEKFLQKAEVSNSDDSNKIRKLNVPGFGVFKCRMLKLNVVYNSEVGTIYIFENNKVNQLKTKIKLLFKIHSILNIHLSYLLNNNNILQDLNNNEDKLSIYNIPNNTYINFKYTDFDYQ